jgi:hypothetical protein
MTDNGLNTYAMYMKYMYNICIAYICLSYTYDISPGEVTALPVRQRGSLGARPVFGVPHHVSRLRNVDFRE